jgi:hypothetical protein
MRGASRDSDTSRQHAWQHRRTFRAVASCGYESVESGGPSTASWMDDSRMHSSITPSKVTCHDADVNHGRIRSELDCSRYRTLELANHAGTYTQTLTMRNAKPQGATSKHAGTQARHPLCIHSESEHATTTHTLSLPERSTAINDEQVVRRVTPSPRSRRVPTHPSCRRERRCDGGTDGVACVSVMWATGRCSRSSSHRACRSHIRGARMHQAACRRRRLRLEADILYLQHRSVALPVIYWHDARRRVIDHTHHTEHSTPHSTHRNTTSVHNVPPLAHCWTHQRAPTRTLNR